MVSKRDLKMVRAFARSKGLLDPVSVRAFGRYLERLKGAGEMGSANAKGDFTWDEMEAHWPAFEQGLSSR